MSEFILYNYFRSSASHRVRIALNLKNISYEYKAVHLLNNGGEQNSAEYKKLNPSQQVPTLIHQGKTISQSVAIMDYLDHVIPTPKLFPEDPYARAKVLQLCEVVNSGIQPLHNLVVLQELEKRYAVDQLEKTSWSAYWINRGLQSLEKILMTTAKSFCFGDAVTAADAFLVPQIFAAKRNQVSLEHYPIIEKIFNYCITQEAFQKAAPELQPDAQ